jgi:hypothetical protein
MVEWPMAAARMKIALYIMGYIALLAPSLFVALMRWVDLADPPVVNPNADPSFWLSGFGQCLWFGLAFVLPALVLYALVRLFRGQDRRES